VMKSSKRKSMTSSMGRRIVAQIRRGRRRAELRRCPIAVRGEYLEWHKMRS
jgi:hypothetical protein